MRNLRIIPVIDLKNGKVVHAVAGEREKYEPVDSVLVDSSNPLPLTREFQEYGFKELYIADLDSIQNQGDNLEIINRLTSETELTVMVDGGFSRIEDVKNYADVGIDKAVIGTETLQDFDLISKISECYELSVIASVDIKESEVITGSSEIEKSIEKLIENFQRNGVSEIIVLNLGKVGTSEGPSTEFLPKILNTASVPILFGGGIRDVSDIKNLSNQGVSGALIATAIHSGSISRRDLDCFL